jgi:ubiquitin-protein ligase E3 C
MQFFGGDFRSKKGIDLGGNKARLDKEKLLQKAQEERRKREQERLRNKSATRLQAFYRGRHGSFLWKEEWRGQLDDILREFQREAIVNPEHLVLAMRILLAVYTPSFDEPRLMYMIDVLLRILPNGMNEHPEPNCL